MSFIFAGAIGYVPIPTPWALYAAGFMFVFLAAILWGLITIFRKEPTTTKNKTEKYHPSNAFLAFMFAAAVILYFIHVQK